MFFPTPPYSHYCEDCMSPAAVLTWALVKLYSFLLEILKDGTLGKLSHLSTCL